MAPLSLHIHHAWRTLGRNVNSILPVRRKLTPPTADDFSFAAMRINISVNDARAAWNVFMFEDPAPNRTPHYPTINA